MTRRRKQAGKVVKVRTWLLSKPKKFVSMLTTRFDRLRDPKPGKIWQTPIGETVFADRRKRKDRRTKQKGRTASVKQGLFGSTDHYVEMDTTDFKNLNEPKPKKVWSTPLGKTGFRERRKKKR